MSIEVGDCVALESPAERFACYEQHVSDAIGGTKGKETSGGPAREGSSPQERAPLNLERRSVPPSGAPSGNAPNALSASRPLPGEPAAGPAVRAEQGAAAEQEDESREYFGTIVSLRERLPNQYVITLDNGQIWQQNVAERYPLRTGHHVRIYPTHWGTSYRLTVEELNSFIQVERVR